MGNPRREDGKRSRGEERWLLRRPDLAVGASRLLTLWHPLLPEFSAALPVEDGLLLLPRPTLPQPLSPGTHARSSAAYLARLAALVSFLKFHGLGVAFEDVARVGSRAGDASRPALGGVPVPEWRASPPALLVGAVAVRLGGGIASGSGPDALRESIERALESGGLGSEAAAAARASLQVHATGRPPERLVSDFSRLVLERESLGLDLLGLAFPAVGEGARDGGDGRVRAVDGDAALFVVRGAARRSPSGFAEILAADRLEEGSGLKSLARLLQGDPRAASLSVLAAGKPVGTWPAGPPVAVVAVSGDLWDERSRRALEGELPRAGFGVFETRTFPPRPWEPRTPLTAALDRADIASLLWLPFRTWTEAAATWDAVASGAGGDAARFLRLARSLAAAFDPAERPAGAIRFLPERASREPILGAAALLGSGFTEAELAPAAGVSEEEASSAITRARDAGLLAPEGRGGWRFRDEAERKRLADRLSAAARRSVVERLGKVKLSSQRFVLAALARGEDEDVRAASVLFEAATRRGDDALALNLLARAPRFAPDLGRPDLSVRIHSAAGKTADARAAASRLSPIRFGSAPLRERAALARLLARFGEAEKALAFVPAEGTAGAFLARAQLLLDLKRTDEAAQTLENPAFQAPDMDAAERLSRARLLAEIASRRGDLQAARRLLDDAAGTLADLEDPDEAWEFLMTAGFVAIDAGRFAEARAFFRRAGDFVRDPRRRADAALDAATASLHAGEYADAEEQLSAALSLYAEAGDEERYLSALGNRIDLAFRAGRYDLARQTLPIVLRHDSRPGREHQFLFGAASLQHLARLDGDGEAASAVFREAETRHPSVPSHPTWREILILEAARLLSARQPAEALQLLETAGGLPDNREQTELLRLRFVASARGDLGREAGEEVRALAPGERVLLCAEEDLRGGSPLRPEALTELESRLGDARGAASAVERLLEWVGRFPAPFSRPSATGLLELGRRAAARAGLSAAGRRFTAALDALAALPRRETRAAEPPPFVAEDPCTRQVVDMVRKVSRTRIPILLLGETGTGKELLAREVHRTSGRPGLFVPVNVASLAGSLIESELFGHVRGAFTGADRERKGYVEEATGGTLFLDEIGDLALPLQAKLLRVLQEGEVRRVGDTKTRPVDLRVVSATHRDLRAMVEDGSFRRDLLYRLAGTEVELPPLRRRPLDLSRLVATGLGPATLTSEAKSAVFGYAWPGNVRELLAALEAARALAAPSDVIGLEHLPPSVRQAAGAASPREGAYREAVADAKRRAISTALEASGGNRTRAARRLGLSRQSLLYEMKVLGLSDTPLDSRPCRSSAASRRSRSSSGVPRRSSSS